MATSGVNVLRYSALGFGVFYGFMHQSSLTSKAKMAQIDAEYKRKADLIQQAKAEWTKQQLPPEKKTASGNIITDPNDSRFDLEAYLNQVAADQTKK